INLCDTVTILRRGKVVANTTTKETTSKQLAELMVGRELSLQLKKPAVSSQEVVLSVQNLQVEDQKGIIAVNNLSFNIKAGEILGVAGVDGNGQRELADAICGLAKIKSGTINPTPQLKQIRIGYIPEDRQKMGLVMQFNVAQNLILKTFYRLPFCRNFLLQKQLINNHANSKLTEYDIRATSPKVKATQLSGGNQQKIVLARELDQEPSLIVAMQPTRGLDIGAIASVQQRLLAQRQRGAAILYISTELEEVIAMSDRIAVMYEGQFLGVMNVDETTIEEIGLLMGGFSIQ
ncbi:MAG: ATP-binding cassette domain-containing protein, partial [Cyanobacteria bacterium P01_A01_bin.45]